jgi:AraC-like DNA-binding protein
MSLHAPAAALRPWVQGLWAASARNPLEDAAHPSEWVMPDGRAHVVIRLGAEPLGLYEDLADTQPQWLTDAVLAGPYDRAYLKDTRRMPGSVGALLQPGALRALFGIGEPQLINQHVPLMQVWPEHTQALVERINAAPSPQAQLAHLEAQLLAQLRPARGLHPQVALALPRLAQGVRIDELVRLSGYSHRRFACLFRDATGMAPKRYACLRRFADTLPASGEPVRWADLAQDAGYSDQAHFVRDFHGFARVTPQTYRRAERQGTRHVQATSSPDQDPRKPPAR